MLVDSKSAIFFNTVDKYYDNCFRSYCKLLSNYSYNLLPEHVAIIRDNLDYLTPSDCKVFNIVARKQSKYFKTFPSIKEIARAAGVSISTVKRALKKLVALGLIESITHQFMTRTSKWWSNVYKIGAWIYHPDLTATMAKYFFIFIGNLFPKSGYLQARLPEPNEPLLYRDMNISNQSLCIKHNSLKKTVIAGAKKVYKTCSQIIGGISRGATTIAQEVNTLLQRQDVSPNCQREEIIKKPGIIEHKTVVDIPEILKNDKLMGLTLAGKVKLSVYPVSALEEVLYQFKNRPKSYRSIENTFTWANSVARKHCDENKIYGLIQWAAAHTLSEKYHVNTAKDPLFEPLKPYKQSPMTREYRKYSNPEGDIMGHGQRMPQCEVPVSNQGPLEIEIQKMIALCEQMHPKYRFAMEARIKQLEWQLINQHN